jgi:hypothetical protein
MVWLFGCWFVMTRISDKDRRPQQVPFKRIHKGGISKTRVMTTRRIQDSERYIEIKEQILTMRYENDSHTSKSPKIAFARLETNVFKPDFNPVMRNDLTHNVDLKGYPGIIN